MGPRRFDVGRTRLSLFHALLRAKDERGGSFPILEDHDRRVLTYTDLLRACLAIAGELRRITEPREQVALMMPSGVAATVAFFGLHACGRVPVMLNFTAGAANLNIACETAKVRTILTSRRFVEIAKLEELVANLGRRWSIVYLEDLRERIGPLQKVAALAQSLAPSVFAAEPSPDDPAVILFTSGSFGAPKAAVLTHANLISNVEQIAAHIAFEPHWIFFSPLPMFHCYGLTGGALLPLLTGHRAFLYTSPLHYKEIPGLIAETNAHVLLATDTFATHYARTAKGDGLRCLKYCVLGAERVRDETRALWSNYGVELLEGYGATEAAPVIAVNQPGDGNRAGTVGRLLQGMETRLESVPGIEDGKRLFVRGPNVMRGYLGSDGAHEDLPDGWHDTGDIVTFDADGFIVIAGRVKRFAKIGGEMVSLNAVESYAAAVWPSNQHAAVSLPCPRKGERLVLVSDAPEAESGELLAWAQQHGAPEIAVPRKVVHVPALPMLGSGKADYVAIQKLAENALDNVRAA
jgi:acyl-[acyl-carrier-protein]-phospholipid O-acyltransferase/long-chain-fatty-acid--[acyl-carrier-protein] ligase